MGNIGRSWELATILPLPLIHDPGVTSNKLLVQKPLSQALLLGGNYAKAANDFLYVVFFSEVDLYLHVLIQEDFQNILLSAKSKMQNCSGMCI